MSRRTIGNLLAQLKTAKKQGLIHGVSVEVPQPPEDDDGNTIVVKILFIPKTPEEKIKRIEQYLTQYYNMAGMKRMARVSVMASIEPATPMEISTELAAYIFVVSHPLIPNSLPTTA
jgi:hypothetical protein